MSEYDWGTRWVGDLRRELEARRAKVDSSRRIIKNTGGAFYAGHVRALAAFDAAIGHPRPCARA